MADPYDVGYEIGQRQAWLSLLMEALGSAHVAQGHDGALPLEHPPCPLGDTGGISVWQGEPEVGHGDNNWAADLSLADVIEKHLMPHLDAPEEPADGQ